MGLILPWGATCLLGPQDKNLMRETLSREAKRSTRWPELALGMDQREMNVCYE